MKFIIRIFVSTLVVISPLTQADRPPFSLPDHAYEVAKGVVYLGGVWQEGRLVEGYAFIHKPKGRSAKPEGKGKPGGGGGKAPSCYAVLAKGARWKIAENYMVDPSNSHDLSDTYVEEQMAMALLAWDGEVDANIFGGQINGLIDGADSIRPDGKNEVMFGAIASPGVIAVTIVWGIYSGPPGGRELVEWDQVYDDEDYSWGNVAAGHTGMDFANIAVHEVGHAAGMGHPEDSCTEETMFSFAGTGETKKRTLNSGDISGVNELY